MSVAEIIPAHATGASGSDVAGSIISSGSAMQQVRTGYTTAVAVQKPRALRDVRRRLEEEADLAGDSFYYGWGAGKNKIEGPSVNLALAAVRCFGNAAVDMLPLQETHESWVFSAVFIDLETGFTLTRQFRQSKKWTVYGDMDAARKEDVRFQIGQSKAIRNVVLNAIPDGLIQAAMEKAKAGCRQRLEEAIAKDGVVNVITSLVKALGRLGVNEKRILHKFGVKELKGLSTEDLVIMRGDIRALDDGREWGDNLYPDPDSPAAQSNGKSTPENVKAKLGLNESESDIPPAEKKPEVRTLPEKAPKYGSAEWKAIYDGLTDEQREAYSTAKQEASELDRKSDSESHAAGYAAVRALS